MTVLHLSVRAARGLWLATWVTLALSVIIPTLIPTSMVYRPTAVQIDGTIVRVHRDYPMDVIGVRRPIISYIETVTAYDGQVCQDQGELVHSTGEAFSEWDISDWAMPCMGGAFVWRSEWTAHAFGAIPLHSVSLQLAVFQEG